MGKLKNSFALASFLIVGQIVAQTTQIPESPKQVVERYLRMVDNGELLTLAGWENVNMLFSTPSMPPKDLHVFITSRHQGVGEMWVKDNHAEVQDAWWDDLGSIDSRMHYEPPRNKTSERNIGVYRLVLTDKHSERGTDGVAREVSGPLQWKIEGPLMRRWTTLEGAIRYVEEMRKKSNDPVIEQNAQQTIKVLQAHVRK